MSLKFHGLAFSALAWLWLVAGTEFSWSNT